MCVAMASEDNNGFEPVSSVMTGTALLLSQWTMPKQLLKTFFFFLLELTGIKVFICDLLDMPNNGEGRKKIYQCIERLAHANQCINPYCSIQGCCAMKSCVDHYWKCYTGITRGCSVCVQLMSVCVYHTKTCRNKSCGVPFCRDIKEQVKKQQGTAKIRVKFVYLR